MVPESEVYEAFKANKPIVFRVDNVPRKSRNKRSTPHERMRDYARMASVVVYQSNWASMYCQPITGEGTVIYNGVDTDLFKPVIKETDPIYLFAYHSQNEHKNFWQAHYLYQLEHRDNPKSEFWFIYDFRGDLPQLESANFDFWNGEKYRHLPQVTSPEAMAALMQQCTHLIYPAIADAAPNVVLEARASGLEVIGYPDPIMSGTAELLDPKLDISLERMGDEYMGLFEIITTPISTI